MRTYKLPTVYKYMCTCECDRIEKQVLQTHVKYLYSTSTYFCKIISQKQNTKHKRQENGAEMKTKTRMVAELLRDWLYRRR